MKPHLLLLLTLAPVNALTEAELIAARDAMDARCEQVMSRQATSPYPPDGPWRYTDQALGALWVGGEHLAAGNQAILELLQKYPVDPDPERQPGDPERMDYHWQINLLHRIWWLFSHNAERFPGRLTPAAEQALLQIFWDSSRRHCRLALANPEHTWYVWGSENHSAMLWSGFWGSAQILAAQPDYRDRTYEDGTTPLEMAAAWDTFFKRYAAERAGHGLLVEIASTYNKYTLQGWYNMVDFAGDPVLRQRLRALLDLFWADWAIEQLDGVRGGAGHRIYPGRTSSLGAFSSGTGLRWLYFGLGGSTYHPAHLCCATSTYRPPLLVYDLALDANGRGSYTYCSRRVGLNLLPKPADADWQTYVLDPDRGGIARVTYATPDFVLGTSQIPARPSGEWAKISSQNRWTGVIFGGARDSRIYFQPGKPQTGSEYNSHWSALHEGTLLVQKLREQERGAGWRVWFSEDLKRVEQDGWIFCVAPRAYAAVKVVSGGYHWEADRPEQHREGTQTGDPGNWLLCDDAYTPVILEVARATEYADLPAFQQAILAAKLRLEGPVLTYPSRTATCRWYTDESQPPEIAGEPIDYAPKLAWDSPFIQGEWGGTKVTLQYHGRREVLDFGVE